MQLTDRAHQYLEQYLSAGALAIDATAGNGHDTLKMAQLIGPTGKIIATDIQADAINSTNKRLLEAAIDSATLILGDHANVLTELCDEYENQASAITFNLGYLPGSNKNIQTKPKTTLIALNAASRLLAPNGALLVTAYRGHEGGMEESILVEQWMRNKESEGHTIHYHEPQANRIPPILWVFIKTKSPGP